MNGKRTHLVWLLSTVLVVAGLSAAQPAAAEGKVNINEATAEQLALLPRVGPAVARRIVEFRDRNGGFRSLEDLMLVRGIGEKTFERLVPYLTLDGETTLSEKVSSRRDEDDGVSRD